ncbi:hypothetical protein KIP88_35090 [Bradyrhizobium sp. SRL28]|uniref:hypothetical protein n=1 Tax=Bradyrhizobium sp. SRL28 TaxID=2836178 RepID=UPI001BDEA82B|nr:hypothetical protein [Bradyrhizobium sp. SRL28]MBT1515707.1 hypothetical protein [Bradyrhizobium sp. SRL28]
MRGIFPEENNPIALFGDYIVVMVAEFRRASAATQRYEQLKRVAPAGQRATSDISRQIYREFYSDETTPDPLGIKNRSRPGLSRSSLLPA